MSAGGSGVTLPIVPPTSGENLTVPVRGPAICRETTALRQFDNKLIELYALNTRLAGREQKNYSLVAMHNRIWMHFRSQRG